MNTKFFALALPLAVSAVAMGQTKTFTVVGEKLAYRNLATVESESEFETFTGKTNAISGSVSYDFSKKLGSGTLNVAVAEIQTGIPLRDEHMRSAGWLNAEKFPTIILKATKVVALRNDEYRVTGTLTLHGVTKNVTGIAKVKYRAAGPATKAAGFDGDVIQISAKLPIKISDYGIVIPDMAKGKVSNDVTLGVSAYAVAK